MKDKLLIEKLYTMLDEYKELEDAGYSIYSKICEFFKAELDDKHLPLDSKLFYEQTAFALGETRIECKLEGWEGLNYSPIYYRADKEKLIFSNPDINHITPKMIEYWEKRSDKVKNPILQYKYSGLVWDFSKKIKKQNPDIKYAQRFVDSSIEMAQLDNKHSFLQHKLKRALDVSVSINDQCRIFLIRDSIMHYEDNHAENNKAGTWGYSFDWLIADKAISKKVQLSQQQEKHIIKTLEERLKILSDKTSSAFNFHHVERIVSKLALYYNKKSNKDNLKRVLLIYKDTSLKSNLPVLGGESMLKKVQQILLQYGLPKEAKQLEPTIQIFQKESLKEFSKIEVPISIPKAVTNDYISKLNQMNVSKALNFIACYFIPDKIESKNKVLKISEQHHLHFFCSTSIMDHTGRTSSVIGSLNDDLDGHIVKQMAQEIILNIIFIKVGFDYLKKKKSLNVKSLSEHLFQSPVFLETHHDIIKSGLEAFFQQNYIACCSILIPQIETTIRHIIQKCGGNIYNISTKEESFTLRPLGALLRDDIFIKTFEQVNKNIPDFFKILLVDEKEWNLRNNICHGHFPAKNFREEIALCIIQILLILSVLRKKKNNV